MIATPKKNTTSILALAVWMLMVGVGVWWVFGHESLPLGCDPSVSHYELQARGRDSLFLRIPNTYISGSYSGCKIAKREAVYLRFEYPAMGPGISLNKEKILRKNLIELELQSGSANGRVELLNKAILPSEVEIDFGSSHNGLLFLGFNSNPNAGGRRGRGFFRQPNGEVIERPTSNFYYVPEDRDKTNVIYVGCAYGGEFASDYQGTFAPGNQGGGCRVWSALSDHFSFHYLISTSRLAEWNDIDRNIHSAISSFEYFPSKPDLISLEQK